MANYDVIVIGAGMGGLAAATLLGARGKSVLVLDALDGPGGKVGRAQHEGVYFDTGPSILTLPHVLDEIFVEAGTTLADEVDLIEATQRYDFADTSLQIFFGLEQTLSEIDSTLGSSAAAEFADFMRYAKNVWEAAAPNFIYGPAPTLGYTLKLGARKWRELLKIDPLHSMKAAIDARIKSPHLRDILLRYATYNGSDPRHAPATLNCIAWVEIGVGAYGIKGSMHQLSCALQSVAERVGVEFRFNTRVERIQIENARVTGVRLGDRSVNCAAVVSNADVTHLVRDLAPELKSIPTTAEPSMSGWTAVIKARRRVTRPAHRVVFPQGEYLQEFREIFDHQRVPQTPTIYLCAQEKAHQTHAWPDHEPLFVMVNAPAEPKDPSKPNIWTQVEANVMARLGDLNLIDNDDQIVWRRTPTQLAATFPGSRGSIYGAASNNRFAAFQRPNNRPKDIKGLTIASGSAHPGGGVPLCLLSGRAAAKSVS